MDLLNRLFKNFLKPKKTKYYRLKEPIFEITYYKVENERVYIYYMHREWTITDLNPKTFRSDIGLKMERISEKEMFIEIL